MSANANPLDTINELVKTLGAEQISAIYRTLNERRDKLNQEAYQKSAQEREAEKAKAVKAKEDAIKRITGLKGWEEFGQLYAEVEKAMADFDSHKVKLTAEVELKCDLKHLGEYDLYQTITMNSVLNTRANSDKYIVTDNAEIKLISLSGIRPRTRAFLILQDSMTATVKEACDQISYYFPEAVAEEKELVKKIQRMQTLYQGWKLDEKGLDLGQLQEAEDKKLTNS